MRLARHGVVLRHRDPVGEARRLPGGWAIDERAVAELEAADARSHGVGLARPLIPEGSVGR